MRGKRLEDGRLSMQLYVYLWVMYAVVYMTKNGYSAAMAQIVNEGIMTKTQTGIILAAFYLVYMPLQVIGGRVADRKNPEKLIIVGLFGAAVSNFIIFLCQNYYLMLAVWTFNAVIQFGVWPGIFKIISAQLKEAHREKYTFLISFSSSFGLILAYIMAIFVQKWQYNFLISAVLLCLFAILLYVLVPYFEKRMVEGDSSACAGAADESQPHPDRDAGESQPHPDRDADESRPHLDSVSSRAVFVRSGFYFLFPVFVFYFLAGNVVKTLSPTMLMESYDSVSPAFGNFMNIFIIIASIAGMILVKFLLYPRFVRDEIKGMLIFLIATIPFLAVVLLMGKIPVASVVVSMALIAMFSSAMTFLQLFYSMRFSKFGKEAEAAGVSNAASALGIVVQNFGLTYLADVFGWKTVTWTLLGLIVLSVAMIAAVLPRWLRFAKKEEI